MSGSPASSNRISTAPNVILYAFVPVADSRGRGDCSGSLEQATLWWDSQQGTGEISRHFLFKKTSAWKLKNLRLFFWQGMSVLKTLYKSKNEDLQVRALVVSFCWSIKWTFSLALLLRCTWRSLSLVGFGKTTTVIVKTTDIFSLYSTF